MTVNGGRRTLREDKRSCNQRNPISICDIPGVKSCDTGDESGDFLGACAYTSSDEKGHIVCLQYEACLNSERLQSTGKLSGLLASCKTGYYGAN